MRVDSGKDETMKDEDRKKLQRQIGRLARTKFKDSIAPRMAIARHLESRLTELGVPKEDHRLCVMNLFPRGR
jgi:hypothetical protein